MKFKWIGGNGFKDLDLVLNDIKTPDEQLFTGSIIEVPDSNKELISRLKVSGNYEEFIEPKKFIKPKKVKKNEDEKEE